MPIFADTLPYMQCKFQKVTLPDKDNVEKRTGYGNLVFLFSNDVKQSIKMMTNNENCISYNKYKRYYYHLLYRGYIGKKRYNIRDTETRKEVYEKVKKETTITPHPLTILKNTPTKNTYFEMARYCQIFNSLTEKMNASRKLLMFWNYFSSIWNSELVSNYTNKFVLIDASQYDKFGGNLQENMKNPLFIFYYTLYRKPELIAELDVDFLIYCHKAVMRFNPSKTENINQAHTIFKREITKVLGKKTELDNLSEDKLAEEESAENIRESLKEKYNFTGDTESEEEITSLKPEEEKAPTTKKEKSTKEMKEKLDKRIEKEVETATKQFKDAGISDSTTELSDAIKVKAEIEIEEDQALIEDMYKFMNTQKVPSKPISSARDMKMRERQESLTMGNLSFSKINEMNSSSRKIPERNIGKSLHTINNNVKIQKFANVNKDYIENVMPADLAKAFTALNNKQMKLYVRDVKVEDSSNELNYKDTYRVTLEDDKGQRHNITVDIPKFIDNKFMYLGGNKKIIDRQNFLYPVVKTASDTVQIVTNYNKMFIRRVGTRSISSVERMMKLISSNDECQKYFTTGNNGNVNRNFLTTIEYDEFSKVFTKFETPNCIIFFNQQEATNYMEDKNIKPPSPHSVFIGLKDKKPVFIDANTQLSSDGESVCDLLVTELPENLQKEFGKTRSTKKLIYNTVTIMSQAIPFIVLLLFWEGITEVFKKLGLKYYFSQKYPAHLKPNEAVIRFKDCYFVYEEDLTISLLMNGMKVLNTEEHEMKDYNENEAYIEYFKKVYGKITILNAINNYYEFMIDPITKEVLEDIHLPTDLVELCIYASSLLADESFTPENSQILSRVRSLEVIPAILYKELSNSYLDYKNSNGKKKISIQRDSVIKQLLALETVEDYSTLNPVVELEKDRTITAKGYRGINVARAYTEEKRSYDDSMIGVIAMNTSPDGNCGITRFLTMEPEITSTRGYVDIKKDHREELKDINLFSPGEMLYPLGNTRDDSIRTSMACKQSKHVIPVQNSSPALISNGTDESILHELSSDFAVCADEDGSVIDYNPTAKVLIVEYKSGKRKAIDLSPHIVKNGGGGFFLSNELMTNLKVGDKVKRDQVLAWHKDFFTDDGINGVRMDVGVLTKVAIMSSYNTYNDSTMITQHLANQATSEMAFCKSVVVGKNANIYDIRSVGDHVEIGDPLISFDVSFEDNELNKLLAHLSDESKETLETGSKNQIRSKYTGTIVDIKIYSTVELEELSESLQKIVKDYYDKINLKKRFVSKFDPENHSVVKCGLLLNETTGRVEPNIYGVIKGQKVQDSVLIEFYISHGDIMGVGDKLAYFTALKSIIGELIPEGYEPYSEFRPEEEVSSVIGPSAVLKRQVPSITLTLLGNKVIVELKRKLAEIYNS